MTFRVAIFAVAALNVLVSMSPLLSISADVSLLIAVFALASRAMMVSAVAAEVAVIPSSKSAFRLVTLVVDTTVNGAAP